MKPMALGVWLTKSLTLASEAKARGGSVSCPQPDGFAHSASPERSRAVGR
jgi:hypothetical protein